MEARCSQCGARYDVNEASIPGRGLSVRCSTCSAVFVVPRPGAKVWTLRQADGKTYVVPDWATLQRWVVERKATRDDELTTDGATWRHLRDVAELQRFFETVEEAKAAKRAEVLAPDAENPLPHEEEKRVNAGLRFLKGAFLFVLGLAAAAISLAVVRPDLLATLRPGATGDLAAKHVANAYVDLWRDTPLALDRSIENFQKAVAIQPGFAQAKAGWALAELARAAHLESEAEVFRTIAEVAPPDRRAALVAEAEVKRGQRRQRLERARDLAASAAEADPDDVYAQRVLADYFRQMNASSELEQALSRAQLATEDDPVVAFVIGTRAASKPESADDAVRYLKKAINTQPGFNRARLALAELHAARGDHAAAKAELEAILIDAPEHARAKVLLASMPVMLAQPAEPQSTPEPQAKGGEPAPNASQMLARAHRLRQADQAERALELYERAADMDPDNAEAQSGMGYCHLDLGDANMAINRFKRALSLVPRYSDAHMGIAEAYRQRAMKRDAIRHYQTYLDILPSGPEARVARRMIDSLQERD